MKRLLAITVILSILLLGMVTPAAANSAQAYWEGSTSGGIVVTDGDCPIVVEGEQLTFDVKTFPEKYYNSAEEFESYDATVTAEYSLYNPSEMDVTVGLAFPIGLNTPNYAYFYNDGVYEDYSSQSTVKLNGQDVPYEIRYTPNDHNGFNAAEEVARIYDSYLQTELFYPSQRVTAYYYTVECERPRVYTDCRVEYDLKKTRVYTDNSHRFLRHDEEGYIQAGWWEQTFCLYVVGEPLSSQPVFQLYEDGTLEAPVEGSVRLKGSEEITFEEYVLKDYSEQLSINRFDYYNAHMQQYMLDRTIVRVYFQNMIKWCKYEISVPAGERAVNTVTVPMLPSIDGGYSPDVYKYEYLLSPAETWKEFGSLNVKINTPYFLLNPSLSGFTRTEAGYEASFAQFPEGELRFDLCEVEKPERTSKYGCAAPLLMCAVFAGCP